MLRGSRTGSSASLGSREKLESACRSRQLLGLMPRYDVGLSSRIAMTDAGLSAAWCGFGVVVTAAKAERCTWLLCANRVRRSLAVCSFRRRIRDTHLRQVDNK